MLLFSKTARSASPGKGVSLNILYPLRHVPVRWTPGGARLQVVCVTFACAVHLT